MNYESDQFLSMDIVSLSIKIMNKLISPTEVTKALLKRIEKENTKLNAYITIMRNEAMESANQAESEIMSGNYKGVLHGIPIGLKDLIYTKGTLTTMGSEIFKNFIPNYDATVVTKLKETGAVIIGKLHLSEFAWGATGDKSCFGPARNPYNTSKITGGSSSGAGAAVSAGLCYGAVATDTGGSIRFPSSLCGVVGMKPSFGRISKYGVFPCAWTLDHVGPMTRTVEDNLILMEALAGYDPNDLYSVKKPLNLGSSLMKASIKNKVLGVPANYYFDDISEEVEESVKKAIMLFEQMGVKIEIVKLPYIDEIIFAQWITALSEAFMIHEERLRSQAVKIEEEVRNRILPGMLFSASDYIKAQQVRCLAVNEFNKLFEKIDILIGPNTTIVAQDIGKKEVIVKGKLHEVRTAVNRLAIPPSFLGLPCLSVPCGFSKDGLPIGMQLITKHFDEATAYQFGYAFEQECSINTLKYNIA